MSNVALEMDHVYKKFKKGEIYDCLRDLIPALFGKMLKGSTVDALGESEFWATEDVSFQVNRGEALGIIGSNGAGKSTILKLLCGIMKPTTGEIRVNGKLSALIEVGAGFHGDLTGRENVFLNGTILGMKKEEINRKFDEIVEFSGLGDFIDTPVKRYSSGMYARLGFSVAAHVDPEILIVDEVLSVGDIAFQNKCMEKMRSIVNDGVAVIFVSHNVKAVAELCNRAILLDHGKILCDSASKDVVNQYLDKGRLMECSREVAFISDTLLRGEHGEILQFHSGEKVIFEVEITANIACEEIDIWMGVLDDNLQIVFTTSYNMLRSASLTLAKSESRVCKFQLNLHLAPGTYHIGAQLTQGCSQSVLDLRLNAATFYITKNKTFRGIANLYSTLVIE